MVRRMRRDSDSGPVQVATAPDGVRAYTSAVPPEALPSVRARDLAAAWDAARSRAMDSSWGEARFFRFPRRDGPTTELALADPDACCWAAAIEQTTGLASLTGLSLCLRLLALVHLIATAGWSRAWVSFRRDGATLDPALLDAAARLPLTAQGLLDQTQLQRQLGAGLPDSAPTFSLGASA
jgi:hypothetical protein